MAEPEIYRESFVTMPDYRYRVYESDGGLVNIQYQERITVAGVSCWETPPNTPPLSGEREAITALAEELLSYARSMPE